MKIVITGANGGIGSKIAHHLSQAHNVIGITHEQCDVADSEQVRKFVAKLDSLDALINCAAILGPVGKFEENNLSSWKKTIETNLLGSVNFCYFCLPLILKSGHGKIINFSGGGGANARLFHTAYATSKAAIVRFSETLAAEYPQIDVNVIAPGAHNTNIWKGETKDPTPQVWADMDRLLKFIDFLISSKSNGITGKFIHYMDRWETFTAANTSGDIYTLRRVEK